MAWLLQNYLILITIYLGATIALTFVGTLVLRAEESGKVRRRISLEMVGACLVFGLIWPWVLYKLLVAMYRYGFSR